MPSADAVKSFTTDGDARWDDRRRTGGDFKTRTPNDESGFDVRLSPERVCGETRWPFLPKPFQSATLIEQVKHALAADH